MEQFLLLLSRHLYFQLLVYAVLADTVLGVLRSIKERKFNSCVGIDGAIRKVAMIFSIIFLMIVDSAIHFDLLFMVPDEYIKFLGITQLGICELFCILYILYEVISILKNMALCGLPVPKLRDFLMKFLDDMTDELPEEVAEELHNGTDNERRLE